MAEAVVAPPNPEANQAIYDVKLFNRWSFDDINVFFLPFSLTGSPLTDL
jgi:hypothetical protein